MQFLKILEHFTINGHKSSLKRNWNMFGQLKVVSAQLQLSIMHWESINLFFFFSFQSLVINEVDEGTECENCLTLCPGYKAHDWRWELKVFVNLLKRKSLKVQKKTVKVKKKNLKNSNLMNFLTSRQQKLQAFQWKAFFSSLSQNNVSLSVSFFFYLQRVSLFLLFTEKKCKQKHSLNTFKQNNNKFHWNTSH